MAINTTSPATTPAAAAAADPLASGKTTLATSYDTFLKLLTTQLKNQDPLSPLDSNQFTQQLVQMTGVQQQLYSNDLLKQLVSNTGTGVSQAVSVIGKDVRATSADSGLVNGKANWNYNLSRAAANVQIQIVDSAGKVVHTESPTDTSAGDHTLTWNGRDLQGLQLADGGPYTLNVTATDSTATAVPTSVFVTGRVTGVEQLNGQTMLTIGGAKVPWSTVTSVTEAAAANTTTTNTPAPTTAAGA